MGSLRKTVWFRPAIRVLKIKEQVTERAGLDKTFKYMYVFSYAEQSGVILRTGTDNAGFFLA